MCGVNERGRGQARRNRAWPTLTSLPEHLHGFDDADHLFQLHFVADLHERRFARSRCEMEDALHGGCDHTPCAGRCFSRRRDGGKQGRRRAGSSGRHRHHRMRSCICVPFQAHAVFALGQFKCTQPGAVEQVDQCFYLGEIHRFPCLCGAIDIQEFNIRGPLAMG